MKQSALHTIKNSLTFWESLYLNHWTLVALICYGASFFIWTKVLESFNVSVVYPIMSLTYVVVLLGASILFGEKVSAISVVGVFLIILGVTFLYVHK